MERFVIIVNGYQSLTNITKRSILDVATALDPPLKEHLWRAAFISRESHTKKNQWGSKENKLGLVPQSAYFEIGKSLQLY